MIMECLKIEVVLDLKASIIESSGKRYVSAYECQVRNLTYAFTVIAVKPTPYVVMQIPKMLDDGTFIIRGHRRVVMLVRRRANVPVLLSKGIMAIHGGKLNLEKTNIYPKLWRQKRTHPAR